jgi:predicted transcriptional regulator of viral defense system
MHAAVWPDGRGVLSHETALDLHDLCDVNPNHIDVTVPKTYRTHRDVPGSYRLHPRNLDAADITSLNGVPIVTPARAIADGIEVGLRPTLIDQAIDKTQQQAVIPSATADVLRALRHGR